MLPVNDISVLDATVTATLSYLLGSVPFGLVMARIMGLGNLREIGSGNIGATNVLRTGNKLAAFLTLLFDAGKGGVAVLIAGALLGGTAAQIAALCAFLGHLFPVWLGFRGGKGVATFLGIMLALNFWAGLATCLTWLAAALVTRISSMGALVSSLSAALWLYIFGLPQAIILSLFLAILVWVRHHENINRLLKGQESKIGKKG
jgi:glycerol-3-phosphate acyltransferase PlsY